MKFIILFCTFLISQNPVFAQCLNNIYQGFGGINRDGGMAVVTDPSGNAYLAGTFTDDIQLGSFQLHGDSVCVFLMKISTTGNVVWAKKLYPVEGYPYNIVLKFSPGGKLLMAGTCEVWHADFDTLHQPFTHGDVFVASFNPLNGSVESFVSMGNHGYTWLNDMDVDSTGCMYVTGGFVGQVSFGTFNMVCTGTTNTFVAKVTSPDHVDWARRVTNSLNSGNAGQKINFDGGGHIYVAGFYGYSCDFGNGHGLSSAVSNNGYISRFDTSGNISWARSSSPGKSYFYQAILDTGNVVVVRESPCTFIYYNSDGDSVASRFVSNNTYNLFRQFSRFGNHLFALGSFSNSILLSDSNYTSPGQHIFLARFNFDGSVDLLRNISTSFSYPGAFDIDHDGNLFIAGGYQNQDTIDGVHVLPVFGNTEVLFLKFCNGAIPVLETPSPDGLSAYPVPFLDKVTIKGTKGDGWITIHSLMGTTVGRWPTEEHATEISVDALPAAMYFLQYSNGNDHWGCRIVKN